MKSEDARETDIAVAVSFDYASLAVAVDSSALAALKAAPGTVHEKRWDHVEWRVPETGP